MVKASSGALGRPVLCGSREPVRCPATTSVSLLERLRRDPADAAAWDEFVGRYRPKVYEWCRGWGVQPADADDVSQLVMAKLLAVMRNFRYDPSGSFRAWLKTVSRRVWDDLRERQFRTEGMVSRLGSLEAKADLEARLESAFDHELLETAMEQVRSRVDGPTWEAFRLTAVEGLTGAEAADGLLMAVGNVYVAKHRVRMLLKAAISKLEK